MKHLLKPEVTRELAEEREYWCPCRILCFLLSHGIAVVRVVVNVDAEGNCIFLRVFNPFEEEVCVKENSVVAIIDPVECVST